MITRLRVCLKVLTANYFLFMDGRGGWIGITPKNTDQLNLMKELSAKLVKIQDDIKKEKEAENAK